MNCDTYLSCASRGLFKPYLVESNYNTRLSKTNYLTTESNRAFFNTCVYDGCILWNSIPLDIRNVDTLGHFINAYKLYLSNSFLI